MCHRQMLGAEPIARCCTSWGYCPFSPQQMQEIFALSVLPLLRMRAVPIATVERKHIHVLQVHICE